MRDVGQQQKMLNSLTMLIILLKNWIYTGKLICFFFKSSKEWVCTNVLETIMTKPHGVFVSWTLDAMGHHT